MQEVEQVVGAGVHDALDEVAEGHDSVAHPAGSPPVGRRERVEVSDEAPVVRISAERAGGGWEFRVSDNGIGIDPRYADRIFAIFQRLHLRDQYGGTGIGLALCRKIVEFHGGRIRLADARDHGDLPGATFVFTLAEDAGVPPHADVTEVPS